MSSPHTLAGASSPLQVAANRRNALKSTGPRTTAGKRRVALNARRSDLCPQELERQLRARGEDPREFRRLHRDLIAIFHPEDRAGVAAVELMARTWWEKARRIRDWVAAGQPRADELDARVEQLLTFIVYVQRQRHGMWRQRLAAVLGRPLGSPADVRRKIEARLFIFGARPGKRKYPRGTPTERLFQQFVEAFGPIPAEKAKDIPDAEARAKGSSEL